MKCRNCIDDTFMDDLGDGLYRCPVCGDEWDVDLDTPFDEFDLDDEPEFIERDGMEFCGACGMLAMPGNEDFDWCDHRTGQGCTWFQDSVFDDGSEW